jgi:hypothetical protein
LAGDNDEENQKTVFYILSFVQMKTDIEYLSKIHDLLLTYKIEVELSSMKPLTKKIYIDHANNFVRWVSNDFEPGARLKKP